MPSRYRRDSDDDSDQNDGTICSLCQSNEPGTMAASIVFWIDCNKCGCWVHNFCAILPAVDISAPSALTSNRAAYSLSTVLFVCVLYVDASKLKLIFFVFFVCVLYVDASKLKFIFFLFNVCCCDLQVQNHFFFMCMCVVVAFQVEIHFF